MQSKAQFVTPAARAVIYNNTPMVTPKFDPRLVLALDLVLASKLLSLNHYEFSIKLTGHAGDLVSFLTRNPSHISSTDRAACN